MRDEPMGLGDARHVHILEVEPFDPDDDTDRFTIVHPARCAELDVLCHVGHYEDNCDPAEFFRHADDTDPADPHLPAVGVGSHSIEGYTVQTCPCGRRTAEWNGGLRLALDGDG